MTYSLSARGDHAHTPSPIPGAATGSVTDNVRLLLRVEGLALATAAAAVYAHAGFSWGLFAALLLAPDISFAGYLGGPRWGAAVYNFAHCTIGPLALGGAGLALGASLVQAIALVLLAHAGFDRALGYGLKYSAGFGATHLDRIGRAGTRETVAT